jgi:hypothetical protein
MRSARLFAPPTERSRGSLTIWTHWVCCKAHPGDVFSSRGEGSARGCAPASERERAASVRGVGRVGAFRARRRKSAAGVCRCGE